MIHLHPIFPARWLLFAMLVVRPFGAVIADEGDLLRQYNQSYKEAGQALQAGRLEEAGGHAESAAAALTELKLLRPNDQNVDRALSQLQTQLAQGRVLQDVLTGNAPKEQALRDAEIPPPKLIHKGAPGFLLPLINEDRVVSLADYPRSMLVLDLWKSNDEGLPLAAQVLRGLREQYGDQGLETLAVSLDDAKGLSRLMEFLETQRVFWPVALEDLGEFRTGYLDKTSMLPAYFLVTPDRRAWLATGSSRLEAAASLCKIIAEERGKETAEAPAGPVPYFPPAEPFVASNLQGESVRVRFDGPAVVVGTSTDDRSRYLGDLGAAFGKFGPQGLTVVAVVSAENLSQAKEFAEENELSFPVFWAKGDLPDAYGPQGYLRWALISAGGRVLKAAPAYRNVDRYKPVLERYASLLVERNYPPVADAAVGANLAHRLYGGRVERVASAAQNGTKDRLIDEESGDAGWTSRPGLPQEIVLSFFEGLPVRASHILVDGRPAADDSLPRDVEILAADAARGPWRPLGRFRLESRSGRQALALPDGQMRFLKLRILSAYGERPDAPRGVRLDEIAVIEHPRARPSLAERMAQRFASESFHDAFDSSDLRFWEQIDFARLRSPPQWRVENGRLEATYAPLVAGEYGYRSTIMLHAYRGWEQFRVEAVVDGVEGAGGLVFNYQDWDNFDRLLMMTGQNSRTGHPEGNSIRLERWRNGQAEVLGLHGEAFPLDEPIRLEVWCGADDVAVKAEGRTILYAPRDEFGAGRIGLFAAQDGCAFDDVRIETLREDKVPSVTLNPLSTASGASIVWVSSQGDEPATWASNLLTTPVFSSAGKWMAKVEDGLPPEVVFAFRGRRVVELRGIGFELAVVDDGVASDAARNVEVLASADAAMNEFRSLGRFELERRPGEQQFELPPTACRYLAVRLADNFGGDRYSLSRVTVELAEPPVEELDDSGRERVEESFGHAADSAEREPNDSLEQANPLIADKSLEGVLHSGETDLYRLPAWPKEDTGGKNLLRVELEALPWLRLKAELLDQAGAPQSPPLADSLARQRVEQVRIHEGPPGYVRLETPDDSLALVIDTSGSMKGREEDVRAAVRQFLRGISPSEDEEIEVLRFSNDVERVADFSRDAEQLIRATSPKLRMDGGTALYRAILEAVNDLSHRQGSQTIVLLSDGVNTAPGVGFDDLCRRLRERPTPLFVIGLGTDLYQYDAESGATALSLLQNLASQTGGRFFFAPEADVLEGLYRRISEELRSGTRYRLSVRWESAPDIDRSTRLASPPPRPRATSLLVPFPPAGDMQLAALVPVLSPTCSSPALLSLASPPGAVELTEAPFPAPAWEPSGFSVPISSELSTGLPRPPPADPGPLWSSRIPQPADLAPLFSRAPRFSSLATVALPSFGHVQVEYPGDEDGSPLPPALMPAIELILDSSQSMSEKVEGEEKFRIAQRTTKDLLARLPDGSQIALRMYGHWGIWLPRRSDSDAAPLDNSDPRLNTDSELVAPFAPLSVRHRETMRKWIDWARPRGKTPLVYSLLEARDDFPADWRGPKTIILLSDGKETSGGELEDVVRAYKDADIDVVIHVVGFDIQGTDAHEQLMEIARAGGGSYLTADNAPQLAKAVRSAVQSIGFAVLDERGGRTVARDVVNGRGLDLEKGRYLVALPGLDVEPLPIRLEPGDAITILLDGQARLRRKVNE